MQFSENRATQQLAAEAMHRTAALLRPGMTEAHIAKAAEREMLALGAEGWWYHGVAALVLVGPQRSLASISGRDYRPSAEICLAENDLVTLDLSPILHGAWGDYARTVYVENGRALLEPQRPARPEFLQGYEMEQRLHRLLAEWAAPDVPYEAIWERMNRLLRQEGWQNLDLHGNLGHSVETAPERRIYLEQGNRATLGGHGTPFTFEPHICRQGAPWGFKREQIYAFDAAGALQAL